MLYEVITDAVTAIDRVVSFVAEVIAVQPSASFIYALVDKIPNESAHEIIVLFEYVHMLFKIRNNFV